MIKTDIFVQLGLSPSGVSQDVKEFQKILVDKNGKFKNFYVSCPNLYSILQNQDPNSIYPFPFIQYLENLNLNQLWKEVMDDSSFQPMLHPDQKLDEGRRSFNIHQNQTEKSITENLLPKLINGESNINSSQILYNEIPLYHSTDKFELKSEEDRILNLLNDTPSQLEVYPSKEPFVNHLDEQDDTIGREIKIDQPSISDREDSFLKT
ncbi:MAG: hypothetical protein ACPLZ9_06880, partial [Candidatus Ratteibacteria bacterium]